MIDRSTVVSGTDAVNLREHMCALYSILLFLLQGVKEDNWEAFIADALFLGKVITVDEFVGLLQLPSLIHKSLPHLPLFIISKIGF